jgi:gas vesicle structural protein
VNRLDLTETGPEGLPELMDDITRNGAKRKTEGAIDAVKEKVTNVLGRDDEDEREDDYEDDDRPGRSGRRQPEPARESTASRRRESRQE